MIYDEIYTPKNNLVQIKDSGIFLKNLNYEYEYAFYLTFKGVTDKIFYSEKDNYLFPYKGDGVYHCTFFQKTSEGIKNSERYMFVLRNKKLIRSEIISEENSYIIKKYDIGSDITFIVFNGAGSDKNIPGFGLSYLLSRGYNVITCAQNKDQYQGLSFDDFKKNISPHIVDKNVFLYGSSLGGYCAIYYAGAVNGTVIAGSPRNTIHPKMKELGKDMPLFKDISYKHVDISTNPRTKKPIYIITDPHVKIDQSFISRCIIPAYNNIRVIEVPFAGHEVLYHVNKIGALTPIITSIVENSEMVNIQKSLLNVDTEFTYLNKANYHYEKLLQNLIEAQNIRSAHPLAVSKINQLKMLIKKTIN